MTREADDLDEAGKLTQQLTDAYVSNARDAAKPQQVQNADGSWPFPNCANPDCGVPMPEGRLKLGRKYCVDCQSDQDRLARSRR